MPLRQHLLKHQKNLQYNLELKALFYSQRIQLLHSRKMLILSPAALDLLQSLFSVPAKAIQEFRCDTGHLGAKLTPCSLCRCLR